MIRKLPLPLQLLAKIGLIIFLMVLMLSNLQAQNLCEPVGWATQNGGTTGGGSATPTVVTNYTELKAAITSATVKVVHVSGKITIPSLGRISFQDQSGKTVYGLPGSLLVSSDLSKDGSGIFNVKRCKNVIFRNLTFEGPAAYDVDGWDNMVLDNCTNIWVDHCEFRDGLDGNLDVKNASDFISITWCKFIYLKPAIPGGPGGSPDHRFSNLFGSSDGATADKGKLSITLQNCWWAEGCKARMPRVRFGKVHVVNNYFNSTVSSSCVMAGFEADILVESNVFEKVNEPIDLMDNTFTAVTSKNNIFTGTTGNTAGSGTSFTPPYQLTIAPASQIKAKVTAADGAGATLTSPTCGGSTNTAPEVSVSSDNASYCDGKAIALNATATDTDGNISKVEFYNGSTLLASVTTSPYTYSWTNANTGTHSITAKATDNGGLTKISTAINITVNAIPSAPAVNSTVTYCQNETATALTATGTSLKWYTSATSGTASSTAPVPLTTTAGTSNHYVSQTVNGCESTRSQINVTVNAIPSAPAVNSNVTYCQNETATVLTATGTSLKWYTVPTSGNASSTAPVPSTSIAGTSKHYVSQTINGCESTRSQISVTVNAIPSAPAVNSNVNYCQNETATALTATGTSLKWYTSPTSGTASSTAPVPATSTAGTSKHYVSQTVNGCESTRSEIAVSVTAKPSTASAGADQNISAPSTVLNANNPASGTGKWTVINGSGTFVDAQNPKTAVNGLATGNNTFQWTISNGSCVASTDQVTIKVGAGPLPQVINGADSIGYGTKGVIYYIANNPGSSYTWTVPAGATIVSGATTASITVNFANSGGTGTITVKETNSYGAATSTKDIKVGAAPAISTVSGPEVVNGGTTQTFTVPADGNPNTKYNWTVPTGASIVSGQGSNQVTVNFPEGTSGNVIVTASNGFGSNTASLPVTVNAISGLWSGNVSFEKAEAYPNPFADEINLTVHSAVTEKLQLNIIDMEGRIVYKSEEWTSNESIKVGKELPEGIYIIQTIGDSKVTMSKVEKLR